VCEGSRGVTGDEGSDGALLLRERRDEEEGEALDELLVEILKVANRPPHRIHLLLHNHIYVIIRKRKGEEKGG